MSEYTDLQKKNFYMQERIDGLEKAAVMANDRASLFIARIDELEGYQEALEDTCNRLQQEIIELKAEAK